MTIRVQLFAAPRQILGREVVELELPPEATVGQLRQRLLAVAAGLAPLGPHLRFAVNGQYAHDAMAIPAGAEVACIPPVSGG